MTVGGGWSPDPSPPPRSQSSLVGGTLALTFAHLSLLAAGYVVAVVLARELGPGAYGVYGLVYSVLLGVELIGRLGVPQTVSRMIAERSRRAHVIEGTGLALTALIYGPLFVVFWLGAPLLAELFQIPEGARLFRLASLDIPFFGAYFIFGHVLNGRRRFHSESLGIAVYATARVLSIGVLVLAGVSIEGALIANVAASIAALLIQTRLVGVTSFRITLAGWRPIVRVAVPVGLFAMASQILLSLDLWSLNALGRTLSPLTKGHYVAATNLARLSNVAGFVMAAVLIPSVAHAFAVGDETAARRHVQLGGRFLAIVLTAICAVVLAEAPGLMTLVFSGDYREGARFLALLTISHGLLYTLFISLCSVLIGASAEREAAAIGLFVLPFAALLNLVLIDSWGGVGAASAAIASCAIATGISLHRVQRRVGSVFKLADLMRVAWAGVGAWGLATLITAEGISLLLELAIVVILYLLALVGLRVIGLAELALLVPSRRPSAS